MMAQIARAARFAMAMVASRSGLRASSALIRGSAELGWCRLRLTSDVMPVTRRRRRYWSPILEMRPRRSLPPLVVQRREAQPGGELTARAEPGRIRDGGR